MAKSGGKQTQNIAGTNKIGKAGLHNGSAKCSKPQHFPPCIYHSQCQYTQANEYHFGGKSSDYGAATAVKLSLYSTCTLYAVSFGSVKKRNRRV